MRFFDKTSVTRGSYTSGPNRQPYISLCPESRTLFHNGKVTLDVNASNVRITKVERNYLTLKSSSYPLDDEDNVTNDCYKESLIKLKVEAFMNSIIVTNS